jgi:hypothetical protein
MNSSITNDSSIDFFATAYAKTALTKTSIVISIIFAFLNIISGIGIIWFERFGSDKKRTLINRLLTSVCLTGIEYYVVVLPFEIVRHLNGPFGNVTCNFLLLFKNILSIQVALFTLGVSVSRYLYIFYLKNPARFQDEFWQLFINIWVVSCGIISQLVFIILPGRQPISFYLFSGQDPRHFGSTLDLKNNYFLKGNILLSVVIHTAVAIRFIFHRIKIEWNATYTHTDNFRKEIIADIVWTVSMFVTFFVYSLVFSKMNSIDPGEIGNYPNYLVLFGLHFAFPLALSTLVTVIFYSKNGAMRSALFERLKELIDTS